MNKNASPRSQGARLLAVLWLIALVNLLSLAQPASALTTQTITFGAIANHMLGSGSFALSASASSNLAVTYSSTTTAVCTLSGPTLSMNAAGTCSINADQAGNATYSAALTVTQSFTVAPNPNNATYVSQTVPATMVAGQSYPVSITVTNTGNSTWSSAGSYPYGLGAYSPYNSTTWGSSRVYLPTGITVAPGKNYTYTFNVSAPTTLGSVNFPQWRMVEQGIVWFGDTSAATSVIITAAPAAPAAQTISFAALSSKTSSTAPFTISATASSGLAVAFTSATPTVCTVAGSTVTLAATGTAGTTGTCTINANQPGNASYNAAPQVTQSFAVTGQSQTITFGTIANHMLGSGSFALSASASSNLAVTYSSTTTAVCTLSGSTLSMNAAGTCSINADQAGNATYSAAPTVTQSFTVAPNPNNATYVSQTVPATMVAGQSYPVSITVTNTGNSTWSSAGSYPYGLGAYSPYNSTTWGSSRVYLPTGITVAPGQNYTYNFNVTAPATPGSVSFQQWRMIEQRIVWFGDTTPAASVVVTATPPPVVSLTSPAAGQTLVAPTALTLSATAAASSGTITQVAFYNGSSLLGTVTQPPYSITLPSMPTGSYVLTAQASDSHGLTSSSSTIGLTIANPWTNGNWVAQTLPSSQSWNNIMYGAGKFVTVSFGSNAAAWSPDGATWNQSTLPASANWLAIAYGNNRFVTIALNSNLVATSPDGVTWSQHSMPSSNSWHALAYGNGLFVATTDSGIAATSPDGVTWTQSPMPGNGAAWIGLDYGNGQFVAVSRTIPNAATSPDGVNWTLRALPANLPWTTVRYGNGRYVASTYNGGSVVTSPDGITWTQSSLPQSALWTSVAYGNGQFVAVAGDTNTDTTAALSSDGINWVSDPLPLSTNWTGVAFGNYRFVAVAGGNVTINAATLQMTETVAPSVVLTSPSANQNFMSPGSVTLTATASSHVGPITQVQYFNGAMLLGSATQSPFTVNWANVAAGTYSITAVATDSGGITVTSSPVSIKVESLHISLSSPVNGSQVREGNVAISALVSESFSTIAQVAFYNGSALMGTVTQQPYSIDFKNFTPGTYTFTAQVTDGAGFTATSAPVVVTVLPQVGGGSGAVRVYDIYSDQLNTPRLITDQSGNAVWKWDQTEPFGDNLPNQDPNGTGNQFIFNLRNAGQYSDIETGLFYNYYRDYDPSTGRYIESDPIGLKGGINTYPYVEENPVSRFDSFGLDDCPGGDWSEEAGDPGVSAQFGGYVSGGAVNYHCKTNPNLHVKGKQVCIGGGPGAGVGVGGSIGGGAYGAPNIGDLSGWSDWQAYISGGPFSAQGNASGGSSALSKSWGAGVASIRCYTYEVKIVKICPEKSK